MNETQDTYFPLKAHLKFRLMLAHAFVLCSLAGGAYAQPAEMVRAHDAIKHVGDYAMVCGVIASANHIRRSRGEPTYLNFDKPYPEHDFTVVIWGKDRRHFDVMPEKLKGYKACVYGKVETNRGRAQMVLTRQEQMNVAPPAETGDPEQDSQ